MTDEPVDRLKAAQEAYDECSWWRFVRKNILAIRLENALSDVRADEMAKIEAKAGKLPVSVLVPSSDPPPPGDIVDSPLGGYYGLKPGDHLVIHEEVGKLSTAFLNGARLRPGERVLFGGQLRHIEPPVPLDDSAYATEIQIGRAHV